VVEGDLATIERSGSKQTLRLSRVPEGRRPHRQHPLHARRRSQVAHEDVLGGGVRRRGAVAPDPAANRPSLGTFVEHIEIAGSKGQVRTVEIFQADGDRSVMTLTPIEP
jgi:hypothetical protein